MSYPNCCPLCETYKKHSNGSSDYCCRTCYKTKGVDHGTGCERIQCVQPSYSDTGPILFYDSSKPYFEFTNFYNCQIIYDGDIFPSSEHVYQAVKFWHTKNSTKQDDIYNIIRNADTARDALVMAHQYGSMMSPTFLANKEYIMALILRFKFNQNPTLKNLLISTGNRELIEASPIDAYWGYGPDRNGENKLGRLLMELRDIYQQHGGNNRYLIKQ